MRLVTSPLTRSIAITCALVTAALVGCKDEPAPPTPAQEYSDLAWDLKEAVDADVSCRAINKAVAAWETKNGARFAHLVKTVPTLSGGHAKNYQRMEWSFKSAASRCIRPKTRMPPLIEHAPAVERVAKMLPKMEQSFRMR